MDGTEPGSRVIRSVRQAILSSASVLRRSDQIVCALLLVAALVGLTWHATIPLRADAPVEFARTAWLPRGFVVDGNRAEWVEWTLLPGIGPTLARRIVEQRRREGPWERIEQLQTVPGIGPRRIEAMRPYVRFDPADGDDQSAPRSSAGAE